MEFLKSVFNQYNIKLSDQQEMQFDQYYEMLVETNKVMNLTAITEYHEVVIKHFLDSIMLGQYVDLSRNISIIDVGTGAGFPGIPLKILYPDLHIVLLDSLNKRVKFLNEVISALQLDHITAIHGRAEEIARKPEFREQFDLCVSRAVANMNSLSEICLPFVKIGGYFIPYKSAKGIEEEMNALKAIQILGGESENTIQFSIDCNSLFQSELTELSLDLPSSFNMESYQRVFLKIHKISGTPKKYPRKPGTPFKEPLFGC